MTTQSGTNIDHLEWLTRSRSLNQAGSVRLLRILTEKDPEIRGNKRYITCSGALVGISFSLWRAVFLSKITGDHSNRLEQARNFLKILVAENQIGFIQDRNNREWTSYYYINDAFFRLKMLDEEYNDVFPGFKFNELLGVPLSEVWDQYQRDFNRALNHFLPAK